MLLAEGRADFVDTVVLLLDPTKPLYHGSKTMWASLPGAPEVSGVSDKRRFAKSVFIVAGSVTPPSPSPSPSRPNVFFVLVDKKKEDLNYVAFTFTSSARMPGDLTFVMCWVASPTLPK